MSSLHNSDTSSTGVYATKSQKEQDEMYPSNLMGLNQTFKEWNLPDLAKRMLSSDLPDLKIGENVSKRVEGKIQGMYFWAFLKNMLLLSVVTSKLTNRICSQIGHPHLSFKTTTCKINFRF